MDTSLQACLNLLNENGEEVQTSAENVLLTICQNILSHPNDKQYREVRLDDTVVVEKLLSTTGAMECLFDVGFIEAADCLVLPQDASISKLQALHNSLTRKINTRSNVVNYNEKQNLLPDCSTLMEKKFFSEIIQHYEDILQYENTDLQEKARNLIPIAELEIATMRRIRELQKRIKLSQANAEHNAERTLSENDLDVKDLFIMELMHWFKYKFFTWMDSPRCSNCFGFCEPHLIVPSPDPKCPRIEIHRCTGCKAFVKYPRYTDPEPLLSLRRGRCGEWANVFTLFCRSLGYDVRKVYDVTDHIWTEVWSVHEKRWIHVDPCEDVMDRPLIYEKGWKKKLSYVIACSKDEVQDVTWRYTRDLLGVIARRNVCAENKLLQFIESMNKHCQSFNHCSAIRSQYMIKRRLSELIETIHVPTEQNPIDNETYEERTSGSYIWRLNRGEISETCPETSCTWDISRYGETFHLCYSIIKDAYKVFDNDGQILAKVSGWQNGVNETKGGIFRKVENDWKMVYLARSQGETSGQVKWNFELKNPDLCISVFTLHAWVMVFYGATVSWQIEAHFNDSENKEPLVLSFSNCSNYQTEQLRGSIKFSLTATVSGSQGDSAWQHAQLFRQSLESEADQSLIVKIQLEKR